MQVELLEAKFRTFAFGAAEVGSAIARHGSGLRPAAVGAI